MSESSELYVDRGWDRVEEGCIRYRSDCICHGLQTLQPQTIIVMCRKLLKISKHRENLVDVKFKDLQILFFTFFSISLTGFKIF